MVLNDIEKCLKLQEAYVSQLQDMRANINKSLTLNYGSLYYETRIETLRELFKNFKDNHNLILQHTDLNSTSAYIDGHKFQEFEEIYILTLTRLKEKTTPPPAANSTSLGSSSSQSTPHRNNLKLPSITIPTFNGNYKSWRSFRDIFISLVHNNSDYADVQKLHYLKSCVSGEAERLLKQFDITDANYATAWEFLEKRFNNTKVLVNTQLSSLFKQNSIKSENAQSIRNLIDQTEETLHELHALKVNTDNWDPILVHVMVQKLPTETHELWEQHQGSKTELPKYQDLLAFLESRFRILESLEGSATNKNKVFLTQFQKNESKSFKCIKCKNEHKLFQCQAFKNLNTRSRLDFVRKHKLCYNCLSNLHTTINCASKFTCSICKRKHHSLLHLNNQRDSNHLPNLTSKSNACTNLSQISASSSNDNAPNQSQIADAKNFFSSNFTSALLSTALVTVRNKYGHSETLRALIDHGSQVSFITTAAAKRLQLPFTKTHQHISGIEETNTTTSNYQTNFILESKSSQYKAKVNALIIKSITNFLPSQTIDSSGYKHIRGLKLADPNFQKPGKIDILLGAIIYASIIELGIVKPKVINQPIAQKTSLGWILVETIIQSESHCITVVATLRKDKENELHTQNR